MRLVVPLLHITTYALAIVMVLFLPLNLLTHLLSPHNLSGYIVFAFLYVLLCFILFLGARQIISKVKSLTSLLLKEKVIKVGNVTMHIPLINGHMHGTAKSYHPDGSVMITMEFRHDAPNGRVCVIDENGILRHEGYYQNGLLEGITTDYWADGSVFMKTPYVHGKRSGIAEAYYETGSLITKCRFVEDKIDGQVCFRFDHGVSEPTLSRFLQQHEDQSDLSFNHEGPSTKQANDKAELSSKAFMVDKSFCPKLDKSQLSGNTAYMPNEDKIDSYDENIADMGRFPDETKDGIYVTYVNGKLQGSAFKVLDGRCRWIMGFENGQISGHFSKFDEESRPLMKIFPQRGFIYHKGTAALDFSYVGFINGKCSDGVDEQGRVKVNSAEISSLITPHIVDAYAEIFADSLFNFSVFRGGMPATSMQRANKAG